MSKEKNISSVDSIIVAARRYQDKLKSSKHQPDILVLLKETKLNIRNKIVVVILKPNIIYKSILELQKITEKNNDSVHVIRSASGVTLVITEEYLEKTRKLFKNNILKINANLVEIMMKSSIKLETVPGVVGYIFSLFGENDINIVETMSCWKDTLLVINEKDLTKTMELLDFS